MTEDQTKQAQQTWFRDFEALLPAGFHVTCDSSALNAVTGTCSNVCDVAGPTGSSIMRIGVGTQSASPPQGPDSHEHVATTQIPVVSGVQRFPEGTVSVSSIDFEAQAFLPQEQLTAPSEPVMNQARYSFTPSGSGPVFNIQFTELFKHVPWAANISGDERKLFGYNPTGPVLSPEQFAKVAADPRFAALVQQWPTIGAPL